MGVTYKETTTKSESLSRSRRMRMIESLRRRLSR